MAVLAIKANAGTSVSLLLSTSGKTVAQLTPDVSGSVAFANLPDGKYKVELNINMKRFVLDGDVDNDGIADLEITTQQDAATGNKNVKMSRTFRVLLNDKGKRKSISMSEWSQIQAKTITADGTQTITAVEIKIEGNSIKIKTVYSPILEDMKSSL